MIQDWTNRPIPCFHNLLCTKYAQTSEQKRQGVHRLNEEFRQTNIFAAY
jgi:hypothetical protein